MKPSDKALNEALSVTQIPEENMREYMRRVLTAAYAAQFPPSEEYAGLVERLNILDGNETQWSAVWEIAEEAADALEALLAERAAWKGRQEATAAILKRVEDERDEWKKQAEICRDKMQEAEIILGKHVQENDKLKAELDKAQEIARVQAERIGSYIKTIEDRDALLACLAPSDNDCIEIGEGIKVEGAKFVTHENSSMLASGRFYIDTSKYSRLAPVEASTDSLTNGMAVTMPDGEEKRLVVAPADDESLVEIAVRTIHKEAKRGPVFDGNLIPATIAAIRPHIEAAERERIADTIKNWGDDPHFQLLAAAIRSQK